LVVQFLGFTGMYFADSRATRHGWGTIHSPFLSPPLVEVNWQ
jgi:hypothetical protein